MNNPLESLLGANWRTTLAGAVAAGVDAYREGAFSDPTDYKKWLLPVAFAVFGFLTKDKSVTGGSVRNDPPAKTPGQIKDA